MEDCTPRHHPATCALRPTNCTEPFHSGAFFYFQKLYATEPTTREAWLALNELAEEKVHVRLDWNGDEPLALQLSWVTLFSYFSPEAASSAADRSLRIRPCPLGTGSSP